jgi:hypothetical protein
MPFRMLVDASSVVAHADARWPRLTVRSPFTHKFLASTLT